MTPLRLERLERRDNPAGTVTATLRGSTWTITGDAEDNDILINPDATPGRFVLDGVTTFVEGDAIADGVRKIVVRMGDGADRVNLNISVLFGTLQDLVVDGGDGANLLSVGRMDIEGNVRVTNGTNPADGTAADDTSFFRSTVGGSVVVRNGDGDSSTEFTSETAGFARIGGSFTVVNGVGDHVTSSTDTDVGGNVTFRNGPAGTGGGLRGAGVFNDENTDRPATVGGDVRISYVSGESPTDDYVLDAAIAGDVSVNYGRSAGGLRIDAFNTLRPVVVLGDVSVRGGAGLQVGLGAGYAERGLLVGGNLAVRAGGDTDLRFVRVEVAGKTTIVTGGEDDYVGINDSTLHALSANLGRGADAFEADVSGGYSGVTRFLGKTRVAFGESGTLRLGEVDADARVDILAPFRVTTKDVLVTTLINVFDPFEHFDS